MKPNIQKPEQSGKAAQKEKAGDAKDDSTERHVGPLPDDSEKRKRHDAKSYRRAQAGGQTKPGQELRGCVGLRPLHEQRKQIGTK